MESILLAVAALACPVGMGLMMWMMGRGQRRGAQEDKTIHGEQVEQVARLRAEVDQLKAERAARAEEAR